SRLRHCKELSSPWRGGEFTSSSGLTGHVRLLVKFCWEGVAAVETLAPEQRKRSFHDVRFGSKANVTSALSPKADIAASPRASNLPHCKCASQSHGKHRTRQMKRVH